jgi:signal transduction histidine kinase
VKVGQRLFLAVVPAVLGVFTVAALAYWGRYQESAPVWLVLTAVVAAVISLLVAWLNTRYVARRIESLAGRKLERIRVLGGLRGPASTSADELDTIEDVVERLSSAVSVAEAARSSAIEAANARKEEYAELISLAASRVSERLEEVRLPLHILLENHFGDLNENQEEMLGAARIASEAADEEMVRLRDIGDLDRGVIGLRKDPVNPGDAIRSILPLLEADAISRSIAIEVEGIAPALPSVYVDRSRFQEALTLFLRESLRRTADSATLTIGAESEPVRLVISVSHGSIAADPRVMALAVRLLQAQGATVEEGAGGTTIALPRRAP